MSFLLQNELILSLPFLVVESDTVRVHTLREESAVLALRIEGTAAGGVVGGPRETLVHDHGLELLLTGKNAVSAGLK